MFGRLKKKVRADIYVSSDAEIKQLLSSVAGTDMELPVLLAAFGPMRRREICALSSNDISGNIVHVCKNMVINGDREWIIKPPHTHIFGFTGSYGKQLFLRTIQHEMQHERKIP